MSKRQMQNIVSRVEADIQSVHVHASPGQQPPNPLQEALDNYVIMADDLAASKDELNQLRQQLTGVLTENEQLRLALLSQRQFYEQQVKEQKVFYQEQLVSVTAERDNYKEYAVGICSRVASLREAATHIEREAMKLTDRRVVVTPSHVDDQEQLEQLSAAEMIRKLPVFNDSRQ